MSYFGYSASVGIEWKDFTPSHDCCGFLKALSVGWGDSTVPADGVLGVYRSGKSTLLFHVLSCVGLPMLTTG